jgi:hypothetical protein
LFDLVGHSHIGIETYIGIYRHIGYLHLLIGITGLSKPICDHWCLTHSNQDQVNVLESIRGLNKAHRDAKEFDLLLTYGQED